MKRLNRRNFLQTTALAGAGLAAGNALQASPTILSTPLKDKINIGVIGTGLRGQAHIDLLLNRDDCALTAICDIDSAMIDRTKALITKKGAKMPKVYGLGEQDYLALLEDEKVDASARG
ncbi:MAG: twin-arginine translocation signal domain-containing protein [Bacteroidota bacterium]